MGLWVARGINNFKPITCPSKVPVVVAHLDWLIYPYGLEMGSSSPSSLSFDEQDCPVAAATLTVISVILVLTGFWALVRVNFFSSTGVIFHAFRLSRAVSGAVCASAETLSSKRACWLAHKWKNTHARGWRGVVLHVAWWWQQYLFQLVRWRDQRASGSLAWHILSDQNNTRRSLVCKYLPEQCFCPTTAFSFHPQYFHLLWTCLMWTFFC